MGVTKIAKDAIEERIAKKKKKQAEAEAKITPKKGSIATKTTVSATDIKQAKTARELDAMQRQIDDMPEGANKKSYQKLLDKARERFEDMQAAEKDAVVRKQQDTARSNKMKDQVTLPEAPFDIPKKRKGGVMKKAMPFNRGGMSSRKGNFDMRKGGLFAK